LSSRTTDDALRRLLDEGRVRAAAIDADHARLWEALAAATEGGKRFRPALLTATHDALGGDSTFAALEVGAAVELLHTAFVIHDDVIDGDHVRRGRPNVSGTFRAQALGDGAGASEADGYGCTAAILAGARSRVRRTSASSPAAVVCRAASKRSSNRCTTPTGAPHVATARTAVVRARSPARIAAVRP